MKSWRQVSVKYAKPFSSTYLRARMENILQQRRKLKELFLSTIADYPQWKAGRS